jgi:hypothetical protein
LKHAQSAILFENRSHQTLRRIIEYHRRRGSHGGSQPPAVESVSRARLGDQPSGQGR